MTPGPRAPRASRRRLLLVAMAAALSATLTVALLEVGVRVLRLTPDKSMLPHRTMPGDEAQAPRPNAQARSLLGVLEATNSLGLRDPERPLARVDGERRVALVGDSVAFGFGLPAEATIARRMEALGPGTAVWTLAQPATTWVNHAARCERLLSEIAPDVVVGLVLYNDLLPGATRFRVTPSGLLAATSRRAPYPDLARPLIDRSASFFVTMRGLYGLRRALDPREEFSVRWAPDLLGGLERAWRAGQGVRWILAILPGAYEDPGGYAALTVLVRDFAAPRGIEVVDLAAVLGAPADRAFLQPRDATHPNAAGADRIATALVEALGPL